jgi:hypothetical protein
MHLVINERNNPTASWFDTLATALVAPGAFAPATAAFYGGARMITLETLVWIAPVMAAVAVLTTGFFEVWLIDYLDRRRRVGRSASTRP